jgi:hypothetical protein
MRDSFMSSLDGGGNNVMTVKGKDIPVAGRGDP